MSASRGKSAEVKNSDENKATCAPVWAHHDIYFSTDEDDEECDEISTSKKQKIVDDVIDVSDTDDFPALEPPAHDQ